MKKHLRRIGIVIASPFILFLVLASLLSIPAVQNYAVDKATDYLHEETGLDVHIDMIRLAFPLDLTFHQLYATKNNAVVIDAKSFRARIKLWPLLKKRIDIDGIELYNTKLNTLDLISDTQIKGEINALNITAHDIDLGKETAHINEALLDNANLEIKLSDTAQQDTTPSKNKWIISVDNVCITKTACFVRMPKDSMHIGVGMQLAKMKNGLFDLGKGNYEVDRFDLRSAKIDYDIPYEPRTMQQFDANHIHIYDLNGELCNASYKGKSIRTDVKKLSFCEKSGLSLRNLTGRILSDEKKLTVSGFKLNTAYSELASTVSMDWASFGNPVQGALSLILEGNLDKRDLLPFVGKGTIAQWVNQLPRQSLNVYATIRGNKDDLKIEQLKLRLPSAFRLSLQGNLKDITKDSQRGNFLFNLHTENLDFIKKAAGLSNSGIRIPRNMSAAGRIAFNGNTYGVKMKGNVNRGTLQLNGQYNTKNEAYTGNLLTKTFPINSFVESLPLCNLSGTFRIKGHGLDFLSPSTRLQANALVTNLRYDTLNLRNVRLSAILQKGKGNAHFTSDNDILKGNGDVNILISNKQIKAELKSGIETVNLRKFMAGEDSLLLASTINISAQSDRKFKNYKTQGGISNIQIYTHGKSYPAKDLDFLFANYRDTLFARIKAGDLDAGFAAQGSLENLIGKLSKFFTTLQEQINKGELNRTALREMLPDMGMRIHSGNDNPIINYVKYAVGYNLRRLDLNLKMSPINGIDGMGELTGLSTGTFMIDSTHLTLYEDSTGFKVNGHILNNSPKNPYHFEALLNGYLNQENAGFDAIYKDPNGKEGINIGSEINFLPEGIKLHLYPKHPIIAYRNFTINSDNYILLKKSNDIQADVDLLADDGTGLKIYSNDEDSIPSFTVSVSRLNLGELTTAIPYLPQMSGFLSGDIHIQQENNVFSAVSDLNVEDMTYAGCPFGNIGAEFSYLPDENMKEHFVDAIISHESTPVAHVSGKYIDQNDGELNMNLSLEQFPLDLLNGFTGETIGLDGYGNGEITLTGNIGKPSINGDILLDSLRLYSDIYGFNLHTDSQRVKIEHNNIHLNNVNLYSIGTNPLTINGNVNFADFNKIKLSLAMQARNFEIIEAEKTEKSEVYGKVLTNYTGTVDGTTNNLKIRGTLSLLGNSELGYVLKDTPLSVDDRLSDLVTFVDFRDSTHTKHKEFPEVMGIDMIMAVNISNAARVHCDLSSDGQSYLDVEGGGDFTFKYTPDGNMTLTGRYTVNSGEMKYTLPVIPLKTFQLVSGSYIDFTGEPMNPTLNIQAKERVRASVNDNNNPRSVAFDVGVNITKQLNDMGLEFTIEAPEDGTVQNELAAISREQRGKLAVSMLVTGMYLAENNSTGFSANNALNAFLQSEIQQIAGNALKTVDLSLSLDNGVSANGSEQTDYSFRFAKRFWGNRVSFIIGGRVSSGSETQNNSFIENVSLEYRLDKNASRYIRLYYNNEANDPLEGELSELGGGVVLRRKASTFGNLFIFGHRKKN